MHTYEFLIKHGEELKILAICTKRIYLFTLHVILRQFWGLNQQITDDMEQTGNLATSSCVRKESLFIWKCYRLASRRDWVKNVEMKAVC